MNVVEPIRDPQDVIELGEILKAKDMRWYVMYTMGIYSGLRISDILRLKVGDVKGKDEIRIREKKTGKEKAFPVNDQLREILAGYCKGKDLDRYLIESKRKPGRAISRVYAYRVIHEAGQQLGLDNLGTHSMRKTFGYHFYTQTKDIALLMRILNHSDQSKTLRYIGIEQENIDNAIRNFRY